MTTAQQWARFDALVDKLTRLPSAQFHYAIPTLTRDTDCGCVVAHAGKWFEDFPPWRCAPATALVLWLGIDLDEAQALWNQSALAGDGWSWSARPGPFGPKYLGDPAGAPGLAEALRRLRVLETRYSR